MKKVRWGPSEEPLDEGDGVRGVGGKPLTREEKRGPTRLNRCGGRREGEGGIGLTCGAVGQLWDRRNGGLGAVERLC